jgi:hypothetical protein
MRYSTLVAGALALVSSTRVLAQTASTTLPTAASTSTSEAASQLDTLSQYAYNVSTDSVDSSTTNKRSGCSLSNLKIRREWYVLFFGFLVMPLLSFPDRYYVGPHSALRRRKHISMQCSVSRKSLQELLLTSSRERRHGMMTL